MDTLKNISEKILINNIKNTLKTEKNIISCSGSISLEKKINLLYYNKDNSIDSITFPNDNENLVKKSCDYATYGYKNENILDKNYRYAYQLSPDKFVVQNFNIYNTEILYKINKFLKYDTEINNIYPELYKLNIYTKDGHFKRHLDTPKSENMFGSLVVCISNIYDGGELYIYHNNKKEIYDLSIKKNEEIIKWVAFYSDCEHEINSVNSGYRVTLTYNIYLKEKTNISHELNNDLIYNTLIKIKKNIIFYNYILGIATQHKYPTMNKFDEKNISKILKGIDLKLYLNLKKLNFNFWIKAVYHIPYDKYFDKNYKKRRKINTESGDNIFLEDNFENIEHGEDIYLFSDDFSSYGGGQNEEYDSLYSCFIKCGSISIKNVKWIIKPNKWNFSNYYVAYGNEASAEIQYVTACFLIKSD